MAAGLSDRRARARDSQRQRRSRSRRRQLGAALTVCLGLSLAGARPAAAAEKLKGEEYQLDLVLPSLRLGLGAAFLQSRSPVAQGMTMGAGFGTELQLGAQLHLVSVPQRPIVFVQPLAGYAYGGLAEGPQHAFTLGVGVGVGGRRIRGMLRPRAVLGGFGSSFAAGLRASVALEAWMGTLGLEAGYDYLSVSESEGVAGGGRHGMHLLLTTDLIALGLVALRGWWQS